MLDFPGLLVKFRLAQLNIFFFWGCESEMTLSTTGCEHTGT